MTEKTPRWRRPGPRSPQSVRVENALWEAYAAEAEKLGLTRNELAVEALERMLGWDPSGPTYLRTDYGQRRLASAAEAARALDDAPTATESAPAARTEPPATAPARRASRPGKADVTQLLEHPGLKRASELVPAGAAVFQEAGGAAVVGIAPPAPAAARKRCGHPGTRVTGGYCKTCDHLIESGGYWKEA